MTNTSVRIWGIAADGKTFTQDASFRSLSRTGAWIEGVMRMIQLGEVIGLQYEANRARVRVGFVDSRQEQNLICGGRSCQWPKVPVGAPRRSHSGGPRSRKQTAIPDADNKARMQLSHDSGQISGFHPVLLSFD